VTRLVLVPLAARLPSFSSCIPPGTATTDIYTLSLHDALPISNTMGPAKAVAAPTNNATISTASKRTRPGLWPKLVAIVSPRARRSEEHTSELQSRFDLVCRLLLEKKKRTRQTRAT